jgi:hypothetical protein
MTGALVRRSVIPKAEGRAFELSAGQVLRVTAIEGKQVGDLTVLNLHDYRERFSAIFTPAMNGRSLRRADHLYSGPPFFNAMLDVEHDTHGVHWIGGRCNRLLYEALGAADHRNCQDNIVDALAPYGIEEHEVPVDTFNIFMAVDTDDQCTFSFRPPVIVQGDYIEFRARMDVLVAISACPNEGELRGEINDYVAKPLGADIYAG